MNLKIEGIIDGAIRIREKIDVELPGHSGLAGAVDEVNRAAQEAQKVALRGRNFISLSRLPAAFLGLALLGFLIWAYWNFFLATSVSVAVPERDFVDENLRYFRKAKMHAVKVDSSAEAIQRISGVPLAKKADVAFIQAGIPVPDSLTVLQTPILEVVVWMTRKEIDPKTRPVSIVLTNVKDEGSHSVAKEFFHRWNSGTKVQYRHEWDSLAQLPGTSEPRYQIPSEVDAVFVVVNVASERNVEAIKQLLSEGFEFRSPYIGAHAAKLRYAQEFRMPAGYISQQPEIPMQETLTYTVPNVLVARPGISDSALANLSKLFETENRQLQSKDFVFNATDASEMFQGLDAFLGILINIILGFLALLGLEMWVYRKRFHELNSLVSLLSMLQSNKDILGEMDPLKKSEKLHYLSTVSDLLSLISAINGFYTQENSSLLFNNQSEVIHQRCDNLKLNIQLKILHAGIKLEPIKAPTSEKP
jgi:hypothetical protein